MATGQPLTSSDPTQAATAMNVVALLRSDVENLSTDLVQHMVTMKSHIVAEIKEGFETRFRSLEADVGSCAQALSRLPHDIGSVAGREILLGKRTRRQQAIDQNIDGIASILSRKRVSWACTLIVCRRLKDSLDQVLSGPDDRSQGGPAHSTLSSLLFAIQGTERKELHNSALGKEATALLSDTVTHLLWSARMGSLFSASGSDSIKQQLPDWLAMHAMAAARYVMRDECFGPTDSNGVTKEERGASDVVWIRSNVTIDQVSRIMRRERTLIESAVCTSIGKVQSYQQKRLRQSGSRVNAEVQGEQSYEGLSRAFHIAVRSVRTSVINLLTEGRNKARESAFREFGFVLEVLNGVEGVPKDGYSVELFEMSESERSLYSGDVERLRRVIGDSDVLQHVGSAEHIQEVESSNNSKLRSLARAFPSLSCTIRFKKKYVKEPREHCAGVNDTNERRDAQIRTEDRFVEWIETRTVSLHQVALFFLYETVRAESMGKLLRTCKDSLRAVHALALAFRGLIQSCNGDEMSATERSLLGEVYLNTKCLTRNVPRGNTRSESLRGKRVSLFVTDAEKKAAKILKLTEASRREYDEYLSRSNTVQDSPVGVFTEESDEEGEDVNEDNYMMHVDPFA